MHATCDNAVPVCASRPLLTALLAACARKLLSLRHCGFNGVLKRCLKLRDDASMPARSMRVTGGATFEVPISERDQKVAALAMHQAQLQTHFRPCAGEGVSLCALPFPSCRSEITCNSKRGSTGREPVLQNALVTYCTCSNVLEKHASHLQRGVTFVTGPGCGPMVPEAT
jgi:hypothetical protein